MSIPLSEEPFDLLSLTPNGMDQLICAQGWKPYRAKQILQWLYQRRVTQIAHMTDLSLYDRERLDIIATINKPKIVDVCQSHDGTVKFLMKLHDGASIETVLIPEHSRRTVCISTQVGCSLDCRFCLTAKLGLRRNLSAGEIIGQVLNAQDYLEDNDKIVPRLTNVVMMGMGEPLANIGPVRDAILNMIHGRWGLGLSPRRITVSTAGIHHRFRSIVELGVNLAVSLNASTNEQRTTVMPAANRLCSLPELLNACRSLSLPHRRRLTFEYVLLRGVNDSQQDAIRLADSIQRIPCTVNLIPFNAISESLYARPDKATISAFQNTLIQHNIVTYLRKTKGFDIWGACGQLGTAARQIT